MLASALVNVSVMPPSRDPVRQKEGKCTEKEACSSSLPCQCWADSEEKGLKSRSRAGVFRAVPPRQYVCPRIKAPVRLTQPGHWEMLCLGFYLLSTGAVTGLDTCQAKAALH